MSFEITVNGHTKTFNTGAEMAEWMDRHKPHRPHKKRKNRNAAKTNTNHRPNKKPKR